MPVQQYPVCATGCETQALPTVLFDICAPEINASEIEELFIANANATAFADVEDPAEWATRLSSTATGATAIRRLYVTGDKPAASDIKRTISKQREIVVDATHTLNYEIDDTNDTNYEAARQLQCQAAVRVWYKTRGNKMFGGNEGLAASNAVRSVLGRGDEIEKLVGTLTWRSKFDPPRVTSPI